MTPQWLIWTRRLQAIAQSGLQYGRDVYDKERYQELSDIAAEMLAHGSAMPAEPIRELFAQEHGYATPKVGVRAIIFDKHNRLLLVREKADGGWTPPGGWADVGATPSEVCIKETREETGYDVRVTRLIAVLDRDKQGHLPIPWHIYIIFFLCEVIGGDAQITTETSDIGWFGRDEIPELSLDRVQPHQIDLFFAHHHDASLPVAFD